MLEKIAAVARTYQVPLVKITSGQRFILIGMNENDLAAIRRDLGPLAEEQPRILGQVCPGLPWHGCLQIRHPGLDRIWEGSSRRSIRGLCTRQSSR